MNSLKAKLNLFLGVSLAASLLLGALIFGVLKFYEARNQGLTSARLLATSAAALAVAELGSETDHERAAMRLVQGFSKSSPQASVVIFGKSGKVLGAYPSKGKKVDYNVDPDCRACHQPGAARTLELATTRGDQTSVALALAPIMAEAACRVCHASSTAPVGYAYIQLPTEATLDDAFTRTMLATFLTFLAALAVFFTARIYLAKSVADPMTGVYDTLKKLSKGQRVDIDHSALPEELDGVFDDFEKARKNLAELGKEAPALAKNGLEKLASLRATVKALKKNLEEEREYTLQIDKTLARVAAEVRDVNSSVDLIAASSEDNSSNLSDLMESVNKVASDAEQLALQVKRSNGSVQQMTKSVQAVAEHVDLLVQKVAAANSRVRLIETGTAEIMTNARDASYLSGEMANSAVVGAQAVTLISDSISTSFKEIIVAAESMRELKKASKSVGDILKIINDINDKTKLLALNAAIIAAQAGEQGRSFAVVAHEIKGLSDRTAASTGDIAKIIDAIQAGVDKALGNVSRGEERLGGSVEAVSQAGTLLSEIANTASDAHRKTATICDSAERQSTATREVAYEVNQVAGMADEIKRKVKEHGSGAEFVESSAQSMMNYTEQVKTAAKEQAETSRYLNEAFTIMDVHLKGVLKSVMVNADLINQSMAEVSGAKKRIDENDRAVNETAAALDSVEASFNEVAELVKKHGEAS